MRNFLILLGLLTLVSADISAVDSAWIAAEPPAVDTLACETYLTCPVCGKCHPSVTGESIGCTGFGCPVESPCCKNCWAEFRCSLHSDSVFTVTFNVRSRIHWGYWKITEVDTIGLGP